MQACREGCKGPECEQPAITTPQLNLAYCFVQPRQTSTKPSTGAPQAPATDHSADKPSMVQQCQGGTTPELPFASCYAQPPPAATAATGGVCIIRQLQDGSRPLQLDAQLMQQHGLKLRPSTTCTPDFIITASSLAAPLAIMAVQSSDPADSLDSPAFLDRCQNMASTFRMHSVILVLPASLGSHSSVLDIACGSRFKGKITLHYSAPSDSLAHTILDLVASLSSRSTHGGSGLQGDAMAAQQQQLNLAAACSSEALAALLSGVASMDAQLPPAAALHALVGVFGSVQLLAGASAEDVMACIGCSQQQAQHLWRVFNTSSVADGQL